MSSASIANVLLQSGSTVPDWILKLPKPSRLKRRLMGKVQRGDMVTKDGSIGRRDANKKKYFFYLAWSCVSLFMTHSVFYRDMIKGSKRRKEKQALERQIQDTRSDE